MVKMGRQLCFASIRPFPFSLIRLQLQGCSKVCNLCSSKEILFHDNVLCTATNNSSVDQTGLSKSNVNK